MSQAATDHPHSCRPRVSAPGLGLVVVAHIALLDVLVSSDVASVASSERTVTVRMLPSPSDSSPATATPPTAERGVAEVKRAPRRERSAQRMRADAPVPKASAAPVTGQHEPAPSVQPAAAPSAPPPTRSADTVLPPRYEAAYLDNPAPTYPPLSRRLGEEGRVMLRVFVEMNGTAGRVEIQRSSGSSRLDEAAEQAVRRWKFIPAKRGDEPVAAWVVVPISFNLRG